MDSRETLGEEFWSAERVPFRRFRGLRMAVRGIASLLLGGLTTMEVLALAMLGVALVGLLWATGSMAPESLVTDPWLRSAWIVALISLLRPVTWLPYLIPFLAFRRLFDAALEGRPTWLRHALAHVLSIGVLAGVLWLVVAAVDGAGRAVLSGLAFASGSGSIVTLGSFGGDWTASRVVGIVAAVVLLRLVLPPLGLDLDLSSHPVLGFVPGPRGAVDRMIVLVAGVSALALGGLAVFLAPGA